MRMIKFIVWAFIFATGCNQIAIPLATSTDRAYREACLIERYFVMKNPSIAKNPRIMKEIRSMIAHKRLLSNKYGLDLYLELARPMHESCWFERINSLTKGGSGEIGWEQIMPSTGRFLGYSPAKLKVLKYNLECGAKFYHDLLVKHHGNHGKALAEYNGGGKWYKIIPAILYSNRVISMRNDLVQYINKYL